MTPSSVRFTEEMLGHVTFGESDFARGAHADRDGSAAFMFHLTIEVEDIERFSNDPLRPAVATGWVHCDALGGQLPVVHTELGGPVAAQGSDGPPLRPPVPVRQNSPVAEQRMSAG